MYREAIRLQSFPPTRYVRGVVTRTYESDDHYPTMLYAFSRHCMATVLQFLFFFFFVSATQLVTHKTFKTNDRTFKNLDSGPEIRCACRLEHEFSEIRPDFWFTPKLWRLSFPICLYRETIRLQYFMPTRYVRGVVTRAHKCDDQYLICSIMLNGHLLGLYCACSTFFRTIFFLLSVWAWKKNV